MANIWQALISSVVFAGALRMSTPIILGSVGGSFAKSSGIFFIAYESLMLTSAFFSMWGSYLTGSALVGSLFGMLVSVLLGVIFGILVFHFGANEIIVGIALNLGAWAITTLLLQSIFGVRGSFISSKIISYSQLHIPLLDGSAFLSEVFNNKIGLVYFAYLFILLGQIIIYKTPFGLRVRGVGINPAAALSAGINLIRYKWLTLIIMSISVGLAGSYLPLSGVSMFTENMTAGRGFLCLAAVLVGNGNPLKTGLVAMLFGYTDALYLTLTSFELPTQLISCIPYVAVVIVLAISRTKMSTSM